ncbi:hypothetical protein LguiA_030555 [Lonicera macranthoides]
MVRMSPNVIGLADFCPPKVVFKCIDVYLLTFSGGMVRMSPNVIGLDFTRRKYCNEMFKEDNVGSTIWARVAKVKNMTIERAHALVPKLCNVSDVSVWTASCSGKFPASLACSLCRTKSAKRSFQDDVLLHKLAGHVLLGATVCITHSNPEPSGCGSLLRSSSGEA